VESWAAQVSGDRARGLRVIRDALEARAKADFLAANGQPIKPPGTRDELKLLYPVYFPENILAASKRVGLDPFLIQALMREESYFNEFAISTSNARGLMQLLPSTAQDVARWENLSAFQVSDLFLPDVNIRLGSRYLGYLHETFSYNSMPAVGAYNGGPGAMKRWLQASPTIKSDPDMFVERIPYEQSRDYIKKVFGSWWNYHRIYSADGQIGL
jgi:soluble lytic murein transglycosylase